MLEKTVEISLVCAKPGENLDAFLECLGGNSIAALLANSEALAGDSFCLKVIAETAMSFNLKPKQLKINADGRFVFLTGPEPFINELIELGVADEPPEDEENDEEKE